MSSAFQQGAFQFSAFQITDRAGDLPFGSTILQRHKVDKLLTGYNFSKERYARERKRLREETRQAERELRAKQQRDYADLGKRKIDYDQYKYVVNSGENAFHALLRDLEHQQAQRAQIQAQLFAQDVAQRIHAAQALAQRNRIIEQMAIAQQFARDTDEEQEALEIAEMDD